MSARPENSRARLQDLPVVYVAGPYSKPDPCENTHIAIGWANRIVGMGVPVIPHLSHFWHTMTPKPYETWLALDLALLYRCDAVFRFPGESSGADAEVVEAEARGIPVFTDFVELCEWLTSADAERPLPPGVQVGQQPVGDAA